MALVVTNVMAQTFDERPIVAFGLTICLRMISSGRTVLQSKERTDRSEHFAFELRTVVREEFRRDTIRVNPMFDELAHNVLSLCVFHWYGSGDLRVPVRDD